MQAELSVALRTDDSCLGVAAVLPLSLFPKLKPLQQITKHFVKHADDACKPQLQAILQDGSAALFISERVHNAPAHVAAPLVAILLRDLQACQTCSDASVAAHAAFASLLVCARTYEDTGQDVRGTGAVAVSHAQVGSARVRTTPRHCCD